MTDKDAPEKPATPGMAEVSAEFVAEAEAAVEAAASTDEALSVLWQECEDLTAQYNDAIEETDLAFAAEKAITDTETPEHRAAATAHEAASQHQQEVSDTLVTTQNCMAKVPARTVAGALSKLRVVGADVADEFKGHDGVLNETRLGSVERLTLSALADLVRLVGTAAAQDPEIDALFDEWQKQEDRHREIEVETTAALQRIPSEIRAKHEAHQGGPASDPDYNEHYVACGADALDDESDRVCDKISDLQKQIIKTPVRTWGGLFTKARVAWHITALDSELDELRPNLNNLPGLDDAIFVWAVLQDAQRLAGEAVPIGAASVIEDPVLVLKREWEARYHTFDKYRDDPDTDDSDEAVQPFYDRLHETEVQILRTHATTPAGVAIKLILWARLHCTADEISGLSWTRKSIEGHPHDLDRLPVMSALLDLERMSSGAVAPEAPAVPVIDEPLLALERRWLEAIKAVDEATPESPPEPSPDDMCAAISDAQEEMAVTPARTIAGVLIKLRLYTSLNGRQFRTNLDDVQGIGPVVSIDQLPSDNLELDERAVVSAMRDLERLADATTVAETPPTKDAALFDAIADYDRLLAVDERLKHRTQIFRKGIPEEAEANKAYEEACAKTSEAWEKVQKTPATTQAGLFARLQATIRFMGDLGEDVDLYQAEWQTIEADVQRIAGEG